MSGSPHHDRGATSAEYALLAAGVAAVVTAAVVVFGGTVTELFTDSCQTIATTTARVSTC